MQIKVSLLAGILTLTIAPVISAAALDDDKQLASQLQEFSKIHEKQPTDFDKLGALNDVFKAHLLKLAKQPSFITTPLTQAKKAGLDIAASPDHNLRVLSWDNQSGGTMRFFQAVAQLRSGDKTTGQDLSPKEEGDSGYYYTGIEEIKTKTQGTIYVLCGGGVGSSICYSRSVQAYAIKNGKLVRAKLFKTPKESLDEIDCYLEERSPDNDKYVEFVWENGNQTLKVPLVDKDMHRTNKFLVYKFDGDKFVFVGH